MNKISSNKSFGILFFIVFFLIGIWPLFNGEVLRIWPIPIALIFLVLGLINSKILTPLNLIWVKFGELLGKIIAPIVMALVYFVVLTPISLILRLIKKDILKLKILKNTDSYWIKRKKKIGSMKKQF
tara:strand:- start:463 stop:843 length:381 start_codon:yes stop_codon:yes gene_type:complete